MPTILIALAFALMASADALPEGVQVPIHDLIAGTWGWEAEGLTCEENPHTFKFSNDRKTMTMRYEKGVAGEPPLEVTYGVLAEGPGYLRMQKTNESEKAGDGSLVVWDWFLLSPQSYCWHRTDWREGGCTKPALRCPSPAADK